MALILIVDQIGGPGYARFRGSILLRFRASMNFPMAFFFRDGYFFKNGVFCHVCLPNPLLKSLHLAARDRTLGWNPPISLILLVRSLL